MNETFRVVVAMIAAVVLYFSLERVYHAMNREESTRRTRRWLAAWLLVIAGCRIDFLEEDYMRSLRVVRIALFVACWLGVFLGMAAAQIPATDDGYTASSSPSNNYGTQPMLNVIGPGVNSYMRFDLTALPAGLTSSNVSKATVRLNINGVTTSGTFDVLSRDQLVDGERDHLQQRSDAGRKGRERNHDSDLETELHWCGRDLGCASLAEFTAFAQLWNRAAAELGQFDLGLVW
jgi:hypothetical protein